MKTKLIQILGPTLVRGCMVAIFGAWTSIVWTEDADRPDGARNCGSLALFELARTLEPDNENLAELLTIVPPVTGFSMTELQWFCKRYHLRFMSAQRVQGDRLVVPSVVHYKEGHYVTIIDRDHYFYKVFDPGLGTTQWMTTKAINAKASGFFLVPKDHFAADFCSPSQAQTDEIVGRGYATTIDDSQDFYRPTDQGQGLPVWRVSEPFISLWIQGEFLRYSTSAGKRVALDLAYQQRSSGFNANAWSFGPSWQCNWRSAVSYDVEKNEITGVWQVVNPPALYAPLGGVRVYAMDGSPEYNTYSAISLATTPSSAGADWNVTYPDGTISFYGYRYGNQTGLDRFYTNYLSWVKDPQGRQMTFNYLTTNNVVLLTSVVDYDNRTNLFIYDTNFLYQVSRVIDPYYRTNVFTYDGSGKLTTIVNAANMTCSFAYDSGSVITNMITPYGTNVFQYSVNTNAGNLVNRSMKATEPDGRTHLFIYRDQATYLSNSSSNTLISFSYPTNQVPNTSPMTNTFDNTWMDARDSFYWSPLCYSKLSTNYLQTGDLNNLTTNDYVLADMKHWLLEDNTRNYLGNTLSMERHASADGTSEGQKIWMDYWGKQPLVGTNFAGQTITNYYANGSGGAPMFAALPLTGGTTSFAYWQYNTWGLSVQAITTYSGSSGVALRTNTFSYSTNGLDLLSIFGPSNELLMSNVFNSVHQITTNYDALNQKTSFTYGSNYNLIRSVSPSGLTTTNIFYASGLYSNFLQSIVQLEISRTNTVSYTNGLPFIVTDDRGLTTTNTWDILKRLVRADYPDGSFLTNSYDKLDLSRTVNRLGYTNSFAYTATRQLLLETNALGTVTAYGYCDCGGLDYVTNALNTPVQLVTHYLRDNLGRITSISYPDGSSATNYYDTLGRITNVIAGFGSTTSTYNNQGLFAAISNAFGQVQSFSYDIRDRATNVLDANGVSINTSYDNMNRLLTRSYPDGGMEKFNYTLNFADVTSYTNQLGSNVINYAYDLSGRKTNEIYTGIATNSYAYSAANDLLTLTDGKGQVTRWNYDQYGRATNKLDATGTEILRSQYDAANRLTNRWSAGKGSTTYKYDRAGNLTNIVYPVSPAISMQYDALSRVTNMVDAAGTTIYGYNNQFLASEDGPWSNDTLSYGYQNGLSISLILQQANASSWTQSYSYDGANRLQTTTSPAGAFSYAYKGPGNLVTNVALPNSSAITNAFDSVARLKGTWLKNSGGAILNSHTYGYNLASQQTSATNFFTNYVNYTYDPIGELRTAKGYESGGNPRLHEQFGYAYDAGGNLNYRTNNALVQTFGVNNLNELTNVTRTGTLTVAGTTTSTATNVTVNTTNSATLYSDKTFAATNLSLANGNNTFTAIAQDSYNRKDTNSAIFNLPTSISLLYDLNGNLTSDGARGFDYDDENQLIRVTVTNAWKTEFTYDGRMRRRIRKEFTWQNSNWAQVSETHYIYDGMLVIQERDANNLSMVTYTRGVDLSGSLDGAGGIGGLLARTSNSDLPSANANAFYHADGNGNITVLINAQQLVVGKYSYDPFGNILSKSGLLADANLYRFSTKEVHSQSGLVYYGARFYDPNLQRWLNRDTVGEQGGLNLYGFAGNSPSAYVDPWGTSPTWGFFPFIVYPEGGPGNPILMTPSIIHGGLSDIPTVTGNDLRYGGRESPPGGREGGGGGGDGVPGNGQSSDKRPDKPNPCDTIKQALARLGKNIRGAIRSMADINNMFDKASIMNNWGAGGTGLMAANAGLAAIAGLAENAAATAPTIWTEGGRRFVVSARGLVRSSTGPGRSTFYYTLARARAARELGAIATGFTDAGEHVGLDFAGEAFETVGAIINPAHHVGEKMQEMGNEMSLSTFETIQSLQDTYRNLSDYATKNCK